MTVFTIYYNQNTGDIVSYVESGLLPPEGEGPKGTARICYDRVLPVLDEKTFQLNRRVDLGTKHLVPLDAPKIIMENPASAENPILSVPDPNNEIRHTGLYGNGEERRHAD